MTEKDTKLRGSTFVTVVGWMAILFIGGLAALFAAQEAMLLLLGEDKSNASSASSALWAPEYIREFASHAKLIIPMVLAFLTFLIVVSIGLIRRKRKAYFLFLLFISIGFVWNLVSLFLLLFDSFGQRRDQIGQWAGPESIPEMDNIMMISTVAFEASVAVIFAWLIRRLLSSGIRREFS